MTSGNGNSASTVAGTAPQNGENKPPQAVVKPQILTHVIEGFVIQEGAEPFPVRTRPRTVGITCFFCFVLHVFCGERGVKISRQETWAKAGVGPGAGREYCLSGEEAGG